MNTPFSGYRCWDPDRISAVINKEALAVQQSDFLATHVPVRRITIGESGHTDEISLLQELNRADAQDAHVFTVIRGIPGTGKSHLIRWLKERYVLAHPNDAVLLVSRADTSLRGTIRQLIDSKIFDDAETAKHLKRLQNAVDILSEETLAEKLLNGLQETKHAIKWDDAQKRLGTFHRRVTPEKIEHLLLDVNVRETLKRPGGPIERITGFLTTGTGSNLGVDKSPGFENNDFDFSADLLRKVGAGGYKETRDFCDDLHLKSEIRDSLVKYLNYSLDSYAIGRATQLGASDLRVMFGELRNRLYRQGKSLALFIEDITAFTGLDEGLIEVLITQHRGVANSAYCRLTSVVGATDAFYADRFQDNIKERVTHLLTLNTGSVRPESELLTDKNTRSEFAARYLNAMRVPEKDLVRWTLNGARPETLPNACEECEFRTICHAAFGSVQLGEGSSHSVGLYPFNSNALNTLYDSLRDGIAKTPRSLLNNILAYVLIGHGEKIPAGQFPPPMSELANDITLPTFDPLAHRAIVAEQGKTDAKRLESLFLFWGDKNVLRRGNGSSFEIGGLSQDVFRAFKLPIIEGLLDRSDTIPKVDDDEGKHIIREKEAETIRDKAPDQSKYTTAIGKWLNGEKLFEYNPLADLTGELIQSFIDWQAAGLSSTQVRDNITGRRLIFDGQSGTPLRGLNRIDLPRTNETGLVLQALSDLTDTSTARSLQPQQYSEHIAKLSIWIRNQEENFVEFAREPEGRKAGEQDLLRLLIQNCVLLSCISGEIAESASQGELNLYQSVIGSCIDSTEEKWQRAWARLSDVYPQEWKSLVRKLDNQGAVHVCRAELLQLLNRAPSMGSRSFFLDAASAIEILRDWNAGDWALKKSRVNPETTDRVWSNALRVHNALMEEWRIAFQTARKGLISSYTELKKLMGDKTPENTFNVIRDLLNRLHGVLEYPRELDAPFLDSPESQRLLPQRLAAVMKNVDAYLKMEGWGATVVMSSQYSFWMNEMSEFLMYFRLFLDKVGLQSAYVSKQVIELRRRSDVERDHKKAVEQYNNLVALLTPFKETGA